MQKTKLGFIVGASLLCLAAVNPPSWSPFVIPSKNKKYTAKIAKVALQTEIRNNSWTLTVFNKQNNIWSKNFEYNGYPAGALTNNGKFFVFVDEHFQPESTMVWIYSENELRKIPGSKFAIPEKSLKNFMNKKLWLASRNSLQLIGNKRMLLKTRNRENRIIDLETGEIKK